MNIKTPLKFKFRLCTGLYCRRRRVSLWRHVRRQTQTFLLLRLPAHRVRWRFFTVNALYKLLTYLLTYLLQWLLLWPETLPLFKLSFRIIFAVSFVFLNLNSIDRLFREPQIEPE